MKIGDKVYYIDWRTGKSCLATVIQDVGNTQINSIIVRLENEQELEVSRSFIVEIKQEQTNHG